MEEKVKVKKKGLKDYPVYECNPSDKEVYNEVAYKTKKTRTKPIKSWDNGDPQRKKVDVVIENTGENIGELNITETIVVDSKEFIKVYVADLFSKLHSLSKTGAKVLFYIMGILRQGETSVYVIPNEALKTLGYQNKSSLYDGLANLCENEIIYRSTSQHLFYVNALYIFNGDRVKFSKVYYFNKYGDDGYNPFKRGRGKY